MAKFLVLCNCGGGDLFIKRVPIRTSKATIKAMVTEWVTQQVNGYDTLFGSGENAVPVIEVVNKLMEMGSDVPFWQVSDSHIMIDKDNLSGLYDHFIKLGGGETPEKWSWR